MPRELVTIGENIWILKYPLKLLGGNLGRNVTLIRLSTGKILLHSTAEFTVEDVRQISDLGEPGWLVESTLFHDTYSGTGTAAFPEVPFLCPRGLKLPSGIKFAPILPAPEEWQDEIKVFEIEGMPKVREHVFYHAASKSLILADLIFNLPPDMGWWTRFLLRVVSGIREFPAVSRLMKMAIKERDRFNESLAKILEADFEKVVVGHGEPILSNAKPTLVSVLKKSGFEAAAPSV